MQETAVQYTIWILFGLVGIVITFFIFGAELPIYLLFAIIGLLLYAYSRNPALEIIGSWMGRLSAVLFIVSLIYYVSTKSFFPSNPFNFLFLKIGGESGINSINSVSHFIGKLILKLIDIIIP